MHNMICVTDVYSREIINMFLSGKCLGLSKTLTLEFTQTINVINVKFCTFIPLSVTLTIFQCHSTVEQL